MRIDIKLCATHWDFNLFQIDSLCTFNVAPISFVPILIQTVWNRKIVIFM